jgi:hypothetical protein
LAGENFDQFGNFKSRARLRFSSQGNVTASTTQTQAGGLQIILDTVRVTSANNNDALTMPISQAGDRITVINASGQTIQVFPALGDAINALGANAAFSLVNTKVVTFHCALAGQWHTQLGA